jgi:hypothetical protein
VRPAGCTAGLRRPSKPSRGWRCDRQLWSSPTTGMLAHDQPRSLAASLAAAREAEAVLGVVEASRFVERALELWPQVPDAVERPASGIGRCCGGQPSLPTSPTTPAGRSPCRRLLAESDTTATGAAVPCCCSGWGCSGRTVATRTALSPPARKRCGWCRPSHSRRLGRRCWPATATSSCSLSVTTKRPTTATRRSRSPGRSGTASSRARCSAPSGLHGVPRRRGRPRPASSSPGDRGATGPARGGPPYQQQRGGRARRSRP